MSVDVGLAQVPTTVNLNGATLPVVAAVFVEGDEYTLDSHVVVYNNGKGRFNVHYLMHLANSESSLHQGDYDLSLDAAVAEMIRRLRA